jgi:hypothetical protein
MKHMMPGMPKMPKSGKGMNSMMQVPAGSTSFIRKRPKKK